MPWRRFHHGRKPTYWSNLKISLLKFGYIRVSRLCQSTNGKPERRQMIKTSRDFQVALRRPYGYVSEVSAARCALRKIRPQGALLTKLQWIRFVGKNHSKWRARNSCSNNWNCFSTTWWKQTSTNGSTGSLLDPWCDWGRTTRDLWMNNKAPEFQTKPWSWLLKSDGHGS